MVPGVPSAAFENWVLEIRRYYVHPDYLSFFANDEMLCVVENILVWIKDGNFPNERQIHGRNYNEDYEYVNEQ